MSWQQATRTLLSTVNKNGRSQWPSGLRRGSAAAYLLRCWVRILEGYGYLSVVSVVWCQVEVSATSWSLLQRTVMCRVWSRNLKHEEALPRNGPQHLRKQKLIRTRLKMCRATSCRYNRLIYSILWQLAVAKCNTGRSGTASTVSNRVSTWCQLCNAINTKHANKICSYKISVNHFL
jgi:hypothetical protein